MKKLFGLAMDIGEQMLISGAEVHRVEESISRICRALGANRTDVFIITSCMVVTIHMGDGNTYTQTRRLTTTNFDFEKLHYLNNLSREICKNKLTAQEIEDRLKRLDSCKKTPVLIEFFCFALIAGAFTLFFGGNIIETVVSFCVGGVARIGVFFAERVISNKIFGKFLATAVVTLLSFLSIKFGLINSEDKVIIGNIMSLIPGIGLTNAIRDLFTGDSIAGLLRSIEAVIIALAIAVGYFLVAILGGFAIWH